MLVWATSVIKKTAQSEPSPNLVTLPPCHAQEDFNGDRLINLLNNELMIMKQSQRLNYF
jgi:hypothetical protein